MKRRQSRRKDRRTSRRRHSRRRGRDTVGGEVGRITGERASGVIGVGGGDRIQYYT